MTKQDKELEDAIANAANNICSAIDEVVKSVEKRNTEAVGKVAEEISTVTSELVTNLGG